MNPFSTYSSLGALLSFPLGALASGEAGKEPDHDLWNILLAAPNRGLLIFLISIFVLFNACLIYLIANGYLILKLPWFSLKPGKGGKGAKPERTNYRKLLLVNVTHLSDRTSGATPSYERYISRLEESERLVPIYDEAIYYTLELLSKEKRTEPRKERSSGVVDARLLIPWQDEVFIRDEGARTIKEWVQLESEEPTNTFLSVSHFVNGLQGKPVESSPEARKDILRSGIKLTDIGTDVREDADWAQVVVDFSSIPNAEKFISAPKACVKYQGVERLAAIVACGRGVFSVRCEDVKKDSSIMIYFQFDWSRRT